MDDFEIVESTRGNKPTQKDPIIITKPGKPGQPVSGKDKLLGAAADNFGEILKLAEEITEIRKTKVQSDAVIKQMAEARKTLLAEAEAYVMKKNADTKSVVENTKVVIEKMHVIRMMMQDFYAQNQQHLSSEDFKAVITEIVDQMCRVENGR